MMREKAKAMMRVYHSAKYMTTTITSLRMNIFTDLVRKIGKGPLRIIPASQSGEGVLGSGCGLLYQMG